MHIRSFANCQSNNKICSGNISSKVKYCLSDIVCQILGDFAKFYTLFTPIYSSFCLPPKKPPAVLPIRIFFAKRPLLKIQRGIPLEENQMGDRLNVPLNVQLKVLFPDFKEKELTVKTFGAELDEKIGLRDLYEDWCYLDGFVYLVVGRRDGGGR